MSKNIYESKVAADAVKRFRKLYEYSFNITEDDDDEMMDMSSSDNTQNDGGAMPNNMEGDGGAMPNDMQDNGDTMPDDMQGDDNAMPNDMQGDGGVQGFNPNNIEDNGSAIPDDMQGDDINTDTMQPDDEVIDIDELTQSQEETEEKVEDVQVSMEKGFEKLLHVIKKLDKMIDNSSLNMEELKQEIEKRNPTPLEKLNMRAANDSYPFNVSPSEYWQTKEATSNYRIGGEEEEDAPQYTITQNDIDNITDFRQISKDLDDSQFNQNLLNIFGLK